MSGTGLAPDQKMIQCASSVAAKQGMTQVAKVDSSCDCYAGRWKMWLTTMGLYSSAGVKLIDLIRELSPISSGRTVDIEDTEYLPAIEDKWELLKSVKRLEDYRTKRNRVAKHNQIVRPRQRV